MKKLWRLAYSLYFLAFFPGLLWGQTTYTPNLKLALPPAAANTWGSDYNNNFVILDTANVTLGLTCTNGQVPVWGTTGFTTCGSQVLGNFTADVAFSGVISPAQITGDQNDYNPASLSTASTLRVSTDATRNMTGLQGGAAGRLIFIHNVGTQVLVLVSESGLSSAINRFSFSANISLAGGQGVILQYDPTSTRWRAASSVSGGATGAFSAITGATNVSAAMVVGTGASMSASGSGTIAATTAAALAANGANCTAGSAPLGVDAAGAVESCTKYLPEPASPPGIPYLTAANTTIIRVPVSGNTSNIVITNGDGFAGAPSWNTGVNIPALAPTNNTFPVGNGAAWIVGTATNCPNSGGNVTQYNSTTHNFDCNVGSGGGSSFSGTLNHIPKATGATSLGDTGIVNNATDYTFDQKIIVGTAGPYFVLDTSAIAASDKTVVVKNQSGDLALTSGAIVDGRCLKGVTTAAGTTIQDSGGVCASGFMKAYWDGGSVTIPAASTCGAQAVVLINSGPSVVTTLCTSANTSSFEGQIALTQALTTFTMALTVNDTVSSSHHYFGAFSAQCRATTTAVNNTWGTGVNADVTMVTANNNYTVTTTNITPNGSCTSGAILFWRFVKNTSTDTDAGTARLIGALMLQTS